MTIRWAKVLPTSSGQVRQWALFSCPRCAGVVAIDVQMTSGPASPEQDIHPTHQIIELAAIPDDASRRFRVAHLPEDVERYFSDAQRVIDAGVADAAAVQLRRTLEAAAAHKGVSKRTLVQSIEQLIEDGYITKDFGGVLHQVRKVGNLGAHHTDERLEEAEVERALRFTTQVLRNLFEVPGELAELEAEAPATPE